MFIRLLRGWESTLQKRDHADKRSQLSGPIRERRAVNVMRGRSYSRRCGEEVEQPFVDGED